MSLEISFDFSSKEATVTVAAIGESFRDLTPLNKVLGKRFEVEVREHFEVRESEPNKKHWPKQNFWSRIRNATAYLSADKDGAIVRISDPAIAMKIWGGDVTPKETKFLSIPAIPEAYGKSPRLNKTLKPLVVKREGKKAAVALADESGTVWYWLVKKVTIPKDARALPVVEKLKSSLVEEAEDYFESIITRGRE